MTKFIKRNLLCIPITLILIIIFLCLYDFVSYKSEGKQVEFPLKTSDSISQEKVPIYSEITNNNIKTMEIQGEDSNFSLHSLNFMDDQNGWIIQDEKDKPGQASSILKTEDGGLQWEKTEIKDMLVSRIKFINKTEGWAIAQPVGETTSDSRVGTMKILHTRDGGNNWTVQWEKKTNITPDGNIWFKDAKNGYALISGVLLSTKDGGENWLTICFNINNFIPQHMSFINGSMGWVTGIIQRENLSISNIETAAKIMVLQTVDGGKHWNNQFEKNYEDDLVGTTDIDFINAKTGWFLSSNLASLTGELYSTSDGGKNWTKVNEIRSSRPIPTELYFTTPQIGWIPLDIGAGPIAGGLLFTNDGGRNFGVIGNENEHGISSAREIYFTSEQQGWSIGMDLNHGDYLIHTANGGKSWEQIYPHIAPVEDVSFVNNKLGYGIGKLTDSQALLRTIDGAKNWESLYSFPEKFIPKFISFTDYNHGWVLGTVEENKADIFKTSDGGRNWVQLNCDISKIQYYSVSYFRFFDINNGMIVTSDFKTLSVYRTKDGGSTWYCTN